MTTTSWLDGAPRSARPLLDAVIAAVEPDQRYVGLMVAGSGATGTMDEFSDLDLVLVCRDEQPRRAAARAARVRGGARTPARLVHRRARRRAAAAHHPVRAAAAARRPQARLRRQLDDRVEDGGVLWERDGAVQTALAAHRRVWPQPDLQWIEDRFWVWVHYMATKIGRGELFECLSALAFCASASSGR